MKIAISGLSGCGNSTACLKVAKKLNLTPVNYTLRNLAHDLGMEFEEITEKRKDDDGYDYLLDRKQLEQFEAEKDAIISSRLAIWMADANLRVWLEAPLKIRAKRIAEREGKRIEETLKRTKRRDEEDRKQYLRLYGIDLLEHGFADVVIDAGKNSAANVANLVAKEARKDKYKNIQRSKYGVKIRERIALNLKKIKC